MYNEKEIIEFLNLPSLPKKKWDGKSSFVNGVAVLNYADGEQGYAVASFDAQNESSPRIKKVFDIRQYVGIEDIFVVPSYMDGDVNEMDLDEQSKEKAKEILGEAEGLENEGVSKDDELENPKNEYYFDNITNDDEARAYIQSYNSRNRIKGRLPKTHEGLVMRLAAIYSDTRK